MWLLWFSRLVMAESFVTPWTVACQASLSMDFPGGNTGVDCHVLSPGDQPDPGVEPTSPALQPDALPQLPEKPQALTNAILLIVFNSSLVPLFLSFLLADLLCELMSFPFCCCC